MPEYRVMPDGEIRVMHLDLEQSWWKRGNSLYERDVSKVEDTIRIATGLQRVVKHHKRYYVSLRVRRELIPQAVAAVTIEFGPQSDSSLLDNTSI